MANQQKGYNMNIIERKEGNPWTILPCCFLIFFFSPKDFRFGLLSLYLTINVIMFLLTLRWIQKYKIDFLKYSFQKIGNMANQQKSYNMTIIDNDPFLSESALEKNKKAVEVFSRYVSSPSVRLDNVKIAVHCGSDLDSEACEKLSEEKLRKIMKDFIDMTRSKFIPVNGKTVKKNKWCIGTFGSIWLDMDNSPYDVDFIRCALYIKSLCKDWSYGSNIDYIVIITVEKEKRLPKDIERNERNRKKREKKKIKKQQVRSVSPTERVNSEQNEFLPFPVPDISSFIPQDPPLN